MTRTNRFPSHSGLRKSLSSRHGARRGHPVTASVSTPRSGGQRQLPPCATRSPHNALRSGNRRTPGRIITSAISLSARIPPRQSPRPRSAFPSMPPSKRSNRPAEHHRTAITETAGTAIPPAASGSVARHRARELRHLTGAPPNAPQSARTTTGQTGQSPHQPPPNENNHQANREGFSLMGTQREQSPGKSRKPFTGNRSAGRTPGHAKSPSRSSTAPIPIELSTTRRSP